MQRTATVAARNGGLALANLSLTEVHHASDTLRGIVAAPNRIFYPTFAHPDGSVGTVGHSSFERTLRLAENLANNPVIQAELSQSPEFAELVLSLANEQREGLLEDSERDDRRDDRRDDERSGRARLASAGGVGLAAAIVSQEDEGVQYDESPFSEVETTCSEQYPSEPALEPEEKASRVERLLERLSTVPPFSWFLQQHLPAARKARAAREFDGDCASGGCCSGGRHHAATAHLHSAPPTETFRPVGTPAFASPTVMVMSAVIVILAIAVHNRTARRA